MSHLFRCQFFFHSDSNLHIRCSGSIYLAFQFLGPHRKEKFGFRLYKFCNTHRSCYRRNMNLPRTARITHLLSSCRLWAEKIFLQRRSYKIRQLFLSQQFAKRFPLTALDAEYIIEFGRNDILMIRLLFELAAVGCTGHDLCPGVATGIGWRVESNASIIQLRCTTQAFKDFGQRLPFGLSLGGVIDILVGILGIHIERKFPAVRDIISHRTGIRIQLYHKHIYQVPQCHEYDQKFHPYPAVQATLVPYHFKYLLYHHGSLLLKIIPYHATLP